MKKNYTSPYDEYIQAQTELAKKQNELMKGCAGCSLAPLGCLIIVCILILISFILEPFI